MKKLLLVITLAFGMTMFSASFNEAAAQKKWSHRKKDAVIGGAIGAGTGAIVSGKHRVRNAVIGGAVGAGAGYAIGRHKDKKKGKLK